MANKSIYRSFNISDAEMLEDSKLKMACFKEDMAAFQAVNSVLFTPEFLTKWQEAITVAETTFDDETVVDQQTQLTEAVAEILGKCRDHFQLAKPHIEMAFPNQPKVWNEFGFNDYDNARKSQRLMIFFMKKFYQVALKYADKLAAIGWGAEHINDTQLLTNQLDEANQAQELFMASRPLLTQQRLEQLNKVYGFTSLVCRFGKLIYKTDFARRSRYFLAVASSGHKPENMTTVTVPTESRRVLYKGAMAPGDLLDITNEGEVALEIWADESDEAEQPSNVLTIEAGQRIQITIDEIAATANMTGFILVANPSADAAGKISLIRVELDE